MVVGALGWREFVGIPGWCPAGFICPLNCPFADLFNPSIGVGFAVLAVAMGSTLKPVIYC